MAHGSSFLAFALCACQCGQGDDTQREDTDPRETGEQQETGQHCETGDIQETGDPEDHCAEVDGFGPVYADTIATWVAQDDLAPWPEAPLVLVGSSSVRRWEGFALAYRDHVPLQRGFGGAQLGEVALSAHDLVTRHEPRAVAVFAGTNDVAAGVDPDVVTDRFRCFRQRVSEALGRDRPVLFIGITPTPSRWDHWDQAEQVNEAVAAIAESDAGVVYVDVPSAFLATGEPPDDSLFVSDGLHLSEAGYALWDSVLRPAIEQATEPAETAGDGWGEAAARILVDFGPSNAEDGEHSPSPDWLGQHWNNWHALDGGSQVLPGEHLDDLVDSGGSPSGVDLVLTGGFAANGRSHGGLLWPEHDPLGSLAVGSATGDFFYAVAEDTTGGFFLRGLDPEARYALRLFAARDDDERRVTAYEVHGATSATASLQTSGAGAGADGATTNDDTVAEIPGVQPDAWGQIFVDVVLEEGSYAYVSALELVVEGQRP